ncbi:MAG: TolC family protein [Gemmatimonadetes bacterium]|nr:TolC family protein [Gemmatimonadota bacterium]
MPSPPDTIVLTLREAGRLALEREPGLQADRQGAAIARGEYRQSRLDGLNPAIDFQQYETGALGGTQAYTVGLSLELPWAGQRGLRIAAARAGMERANATTADAVRLAEATVSLAFFGAVAAERRLQLAEQMAAASQRFFDLTRIQLREGEISALEANLTDIEFGRSRARLLAARRDATAALLELRRLIGVSSVTPIRLVDAAWSAPTAVPSTKTP